MKRIHILIVALVMAITAVAQERTAQNKPYIDLRPLHFGILIGMHMQDIEFKNVGPQTIINEDGTEETRTILCDADSWNPGFSIGVTAEARINAHLSARLTPTMHFGAKHLMFHDLSRPDDKGNPTQTTQDLKNTYISMPLDLKFSAQRFNNYRPYIMAGINPMINLTSKDQDYISLKRYDALLEIGFGCDLYLPYFKLIPELKFCYGLSNCLDTKHADQLQDAGMKAFANSVTNGHSKMIVLTFYFE